MVVRDVQQIGVLQSIGSELSHIDEDRILTMIYCISIGMRYDGRNIISPKNIVPL